MSDTSDPKIIVDSEWKSRVQSEKEAIKQQEQQAPPRELEIPPASFPMLVSTLATQALVALGQVPNPLSDQSELNLPMAGHFIDTLAMLEAKTKGNLSADESAMLGDILHQLRLAFLQLQGGAPPSADPKAGGSIQLP
jgi:hypothetical protein